MFWAEAQSSEAPQSCAKPPPIPPIHAVSIEGAARVGNREDWKTWPTESLSDVSGEDPTADSVFDQAATYRVAHQADRVVDPELGHQARAMGLGRLGADAKGRGDLFGGEPFGDQAEHIPLAWSERFGGQSPAAQEGL